MKQFFKELLKYNHHFNQKLWGVFAEHPDKASVKAAGLYNHILNAHQIWNNRIDPQQTPFGVWELHSIRDCKDIDKTNYERSLLLLERVDLNESVDYTNSKGQVFNNNVRDILFHIINHSTYHRGQIATEFRLHGLEPFKRITTSIKDGY